jgi:hypothetical protein
MSTSNSNSPQLSPEKRLDGSSSAKSALTRASTDLIWLVTFILVLAIAVYFRADLEASQIDDRSESDRRRVNLRAALISPDTLPPITTSWSMDWVIGGALLVFFGFIIFLTFIFLMCFRWRSNYLVSNKYLMIVVLQELKRLNPMYWFLVLGLYGVGGLYMIYRGFQLIRRGLKTPQQRRSNHFGSFCLKIADQVGALRVIV